MDASSKNLNPQQLFADAQALAEQQRLWDAADVLMSGFAQLGDAADAPQTDSLGRPIRGSAPRLMDKAADWLDFLDNLEADGQESPEGTPPRHLRWAQWHTLTGQAEVRRQHPGRAVDHLELAAGLFESEELYLQAVPLLAQIAQCQLAVDDVPRAEDALHRARTLTTRDHTTAQQARDRFGEALDEIAADIASRL